MVRLKEKSTLGGWTSWQHTEMYCKPSTCLLTFHRWSGEQSLMGSLRTPAAFSLSLALGPALTVCHSFLSSLACSPKIFQKTKCSICNSALELPSVHFLCGHSFHQHCFESYSESDADCPTCLPENRKVMDMIRAQEQKRDLHDQFQHQVRKSG